MSDNVLIRPAGKLDLSALAQLYTRVYAHANVGENWTKEKAYLLLDDFLKKQPDLAFLAESNGKIVGGFFKTVKPWWDGNHLDNGELFVHPDFQRKGVGTKLCQTLLKKAVEKYNVSVLEIITFKKKPFPLEWYLSKGYKKSDNLIFLEGIAEDVLKKLNGK
jgi:GNAT superfamily N-acetyltransferase